MAHDVMQWLNEIRSLQEQLNRINQERTQAYQQASRWHQSYQTEACQRRADVKRLEQQIDHLVKENQRLQHQLSLASSPVIPPPPPRVMGDIENDQSGGQFTDLTDGHQPDQLEGLQQTLIEARALSDRLSQALRQEQRDHAQTRQTLMDALSDTIEQLERERKHQGAPTDVSDVDAADVDATDVDATDGPHPPSLPPASPKTPWPGLLLPQSAPTLTASDSDPV